MIGREGSDTKTKFRERDEEQMKGNGGRTEKGEESEM